MTMPIETALRKYKAGDFHGVIRDLAGIPANANQPQTLLVILAQSHLRIGKVLDAARYYRLAGEARGENHLSYLLIAGNLFLRENRVEDAYRIGVKARTIASANPQVAELYHRALRSTCLFEEIEAENNALLARLKAGDPAARISETPHDNIFWCGDEAVNASILLPAITHPVTPAMQAARRARPHRWGERLRIGYLSNDYYESHPMMRLFQGVIVSHGTQRFEVTHFCFTPAEKIAADRMRRHYPNLVPIGHLNDAEAAEFIRARNIDILVDLKGPTNGFRPNLINLGLAPVQVAHHGFCGSGTGIDCDYMISDRIITPDSSKPHYHEKLCRLPETYQPNDNIFRPRPPAPSRASLGLPDDKVVLGFFNGTGKLMPETFRQIVEILRLCEETALWILFFNDFAPGNFMAAIRREGIDPARIILAPKARYSDHIARLQAADILLDAFPCNGHTTTSDGLWAGVPVVTYKGTNFASRVSESLLNALGLPELVADGPDGYIALVRDLATDAGRRRALRAKIAANRETMPLFDTLRFTRHMERAFEMMADRARKGLPPDHIDVPPLERPLQ